ncbi:AT-hook motif nuclear-localized protein 20-like [Salvia divinorum]|uniref:AT-hook motif nuclear-localized protein n=1 Tax=Salvia divinorum TaxID=28513 RepID=A0ABD1GKQ2_SALDI
MANIWNAAMNQDGLNTSNSSGTTNPNPNNDASGIEISQPSGSRSRPRGRPPGSKNKPRAPVPITNHTASTHFLEITTGNDVLQSIAAFAQCRQIGISIFNATGRVTNVTLRKPNGVLTITGICEIVSLSGAFLPKPMLPSGYTGMTVSIAGDQGKVFGGPVVGTLMASGPVTVIAATLTNVNIERLPLQDAGDEMQSQQPQQNSAMAEPLPPPSLSAAMYNNVLSNLLTNGGQMQHGMF